MQSSFSQPFIVCWGIIGPGGISTTFVKDLLLPPGSRGAEDVAHEVVAVGSRDVLRAEAFIRDVVGPAAKDRQCQAYASYEGVWNDPRVDVVYIGTTHTQHYEPAKAALLAGKNVLCEKPFTTTAREARALINIAREQGVFLMEAVWTRFQPLVKEIQQVVASGKIGRVTRIYADLGWNAHVHDLPLTSRVIAPGLAGGALLDLGTYPLLWPFLLISDDEAPSSVSASIQKTAIEGLTSQVDAQTSFTLNYDVQGAQAILSVSIATETDPNRGVVIQGTQGSIVVAHPCFRPESYSVSLLGRASETRRETIEGRGMYWMADEVARCVRDGRRESERMPWRATLRQMEIFDEIRKQGAYVLPEREQL